MSKENGWKEGVLMLDNAALIYRESSPIDVKWALRFYETNKQAMADMKRCAGEEVALNEEVRK
jgi:hypothetical protein